MKTVKTIAIVLVLVPLTLFGASACSSSEADKLELDAPYYVGEEKLERSSEGNGDPIAEGQSLWMSFRTYNSQDGKEQAPEKPLHGVLPFNEELKKSGPEQYEMYKNAFEGNNLGSNFVLEVPNGQGDGVGTVYSIKIIDQSDDEEKVKQWTEQAEEESQAAQEETQQKEEENNKKVEEGTEKIGTASPEEVQKLKDDNKLPTVNMVNDVPEISVPEGANPPKELVIDVLKEGDGAEVKENQDVTVKYVGTRWETPHNPFDSTYPNPEQAKNDKDKDDTKDKNNTATFNVDKVIAGWTKGLVGQKVGSQLLLSIPANLAYGEDPQGAVPQGDLIFYVDIIKAEKAKEESQQGQADQGQSEASPKQEADNKDQQGDQSEPKEGDESKPEEEK